MEILIGPVLFILILFVLIYVSRAIKIVRPFEKGLIERLGKYTRTADSGLTVLFPPFESMRKVESELVGLVPETHSW